MCRLRRFSINRKCFLHILEENRELTDPLLVEGDIMLTQEEKALGRGFSDSATVARRSVCV